MEKTVWFSESTGLKMCGQKYLLPHVFVLLLNKSINVLNPQLHCVTPASNVLNALTPLNPFYYFQILVKLQSHKNVTANFMNLSLEGQCAGLVKM